MDRTGNRKANVKHVVLGALISSMLLLTTVLEKQNLSALTSGDRYTSGFSHGEQQAAIDFQNNGTFNSICAKHTSYYCAGYVKGYNATWNNPAAKAPRLNPSPPASNSTSPHAANIKTTTVNPPTIISRSTESRVVPFIVVLIIAGIAGKLKHRKGKYKKRQHFSDSIKEKVLERQRSDNKESNCAALCPNCHAVRTRAHR